MSAKLGAGHAEHSQPDLVEELPISPPGDKIVTGMPFYFQPTYLLMRLATRTRRGFAEGSCQAKFAATPKRRSEFHTRKCHRHAFLFPTYISVNEAID